MWKFVCKSAIYYKDPMLNLENNEKKENAVHTNCQKKKKDTSQFTTVILKRPLWLS